MLAHKETSAGVFARLALTGSEDDQQPMASPLSKRRS